MTGTLIGEFSRIVGNSDEVVGLLRSLWEKIWELGWEGWSRHRIRVAIRRIMTKHPGKRELESALTLLKHA